MNRVNCFIHNYAQHYRLGIFKKLETELDFDFYFGDKIQGNIEKLDYTELNNFKKELKNIVLFKPPIYFQTGAIPLVFKPYKNYLLLGEYFCLSTWIILIFGRILGKRIFFWTHGFYGNESFFLKKLKFLFYGLSSGVFLYGNYSKSLMIKDGFNPLKLHVIFNSLDYQNQLLIRNNLNYGSVFTKKFNNKRHNIIFIGRLTKIKKLNMLLESLWRLRKSQINVNLTIIGEGPEKDLLINLDKNYNLDTWFYGASYNEDEIGNLIYNSDLCVSPGNVGLTAIHSLTFGTPVITHNKFELQMPEFEAIEKGITGDFFEFDSVDSLTDTIKRWLKYSEKNRDLIRNQCYLTIDSKFNPNYQVNVFSNVIQGK